MRRGAVTILLFGAVLSAAAALAALLAGGIVWPAAGLSLRDPLRPFAAAMILLFAARAIGGEEFRPLLDACVGAPGRRARRIAVLAAASLFVFSLAWSSRAAGGSDSSCYVLQAEAFAHGRVALDSPVASALPDAPNALFAPTGFVPSRSVHGRAVPICAPGLALAMAAAFLVHPGAVFIVVPVTAALLVWLTFMYGRGLEDETTGACAAVLVACSPIVLYQSVQPMSDVPAAAAWMAALVSASPMASGVYASFAILIRPNLALLVLPLLLLKKGPVPFSEKGTGPFLAPGKGDRSLFLAGAAPGVAVWLALNGARYGSVLASGYGDAGTLFALDRVWANLARYPVWILETHTPFVLLALAAPWMLRRDPARLRVAIVSLVCTALLAITYLAYTVFDDWWYTRFLLPAIPIALALSVFVMRRVAARIPSPAGRLTLAAITVALAAWYVHVALARHVTDLQRLESRFVLAGAQAASLPPDIVVFAVQQSGSIRFHGRRDTLAWDAVPGDALDAYLDRLRAAGRVPVLALEDVEDEPFRRRFAGQRAGALDWRPSAALPPPARVRFYDPPAPGSTR
jgi:hypothetical protein